RLRQLHGVDAEHTEDHVDRRTGQHVARAAHGRRTSSRGQTSRRVSLFYADGGVRSWGAPSEERHRPAGARLRRALSHVGGTVRFTGGSPAEQAVATRALRVDPRSARPHVHGFHSYPARLHPLTAASLIEGFSRPNELVLDPFCGSGTSLVEARRLGRRGIGSDLNPLALELCWLKTLAPPPDFLEDMRGAAQGAVEYADDRRLAKAGPLQSYPQATRRAFPIHVLLELDSLRQAVHAVEDTRLRRALLLVFSSLLTKVSNQESDTSKKLVTPRLRSGFT